MKFQINYIDILFLFLPPSGVISFQLNLRMGVVNMTIDMNGCTDNG